MPGISNHNFRQIYYRFFRQVLALHLRRGCSYAEAQDLTQEAFMECWRSRETFDRTKGSLERWITAIARNVARDHERRRRSFKRGGGLVISSLDQATRDDEAPCIQEPTDEGGTPEDRLVAIYALRQIEACLEQMGSKMRTCFLMAQELPYDDIARLLEIRPATVRSNVSQARARIRQALQPEILPPTGRDRNNDDATTITH